MIIRLGNMLHTATGKGILYIIIWSPDDELTEAPSKVPLKRVCSFSAFHRF